MIAAVRDALEKLDLDWRIVAADANPELSAACHAADSRHRLPLIGSGDYVDSLLDICREEHVRLVIPTIDTELAKLSASANAFADANVRVNIGGPEFVAIARDKRLTAERLGVIGVATPRTFGLDEIEAGLDFPLIAKPPGGSSSAGIARYRSIDDYHRSPPQPGDMLQELLEGPEYTVNVFCSVDGTFRCAVPHQRLEVRAGEVSKALTERRADLTAVAQKIAALPGARGVFCFQAILTREGPVVFEINARFGGGYPVAHHAGATFTRWLLEEVTGAPSTASDEWQDGLLCLRYDAEVFVS